MEHSRVSAEPANGNTLAYRLGRLEQTVHELDRRVDDTNDLSVRHEEQINGDRGLSKAIDVLSDEVRSLRRAAWTVAGSIVVSAVGFALAVLSGAFQ